MLFHACRSIITDEFMRVKGSDGSIFAFGDSSTIFQPKALDYAKELFDQADVDKDGELTLKELQAILAKVRIQCTSRC